MNTTNSIQKGGSDMKSTINQTRTMALIKGKWYTVLQIDPAKNIVIVEDDNQNPHLFHVDSVLMFKDEPLVRLTHLLDSRKTRKKN